MKKLIINLLVFSVILIPGYLHATDWSKPDKGCFKFQKDVDNEVSEVSNIMASVYYEGKIFNFINYDTKIVLRKLNNAGGLDIKWNCSQTNDIKNLSGLDWSYWQPAPVVFNNQLYLFVIEDDNSVSYSVYNSALDSWSERKKIYTANNSKKILSNGMSAVVVGNRLYLITTNNGRELVINWTNDLETWYDYYVSGTIINNDNWTQNISAVTVSLIINGERREKLVFAFIDKDGHPVSYEYYTDSDIDSAPVLISKKTISSETTYQSVALAAGTVTGDSKSTGKSIQAFLKKDSKDNGYIRYRIQRYQLSENAASWTKQENNLLKQNYGWASKRLPLTALNYPIPDGNDIRQFMCLIYRGYDDWNNPLNVAWAETDRLIYNPAGTNQMALAGPENTQYIGYIEGPPPFYLNNEKGLEDPYINSTVSAPISELEFSTSSSQSSEEEMGYDIGGSVSFNYGWFKSELSYSFGQVWGSEYKKTIKHALTVHAEENASGYYITFTPVINRAQYFQNDVNGTRIDTIYTFYMTDPRYNIEPAELENGLIPRNPLTYRDRKDINFSPYTTSMYGSSSNSWVGGISSSTDIQVDASESETNTHSVKVKADFDLLSLFGLGVNGSFEYKLKTTTSIGSELSAKTQLNPAVESTDITKLNYDVYWIKPVFNSSVNNWWLHEGAEDQETWCITYAVTYIKRKDGTTYRAITPIRQNDELNNDLMDSDEIEVSGFTAGKTKNGIELFWQARTEDKNYTFEIQRSVNSSPDAFETVDIVEMNSAGEYSFKDEVSSEGDINYRLKITDEDGYSIYSKIITISNDGQVPSQYSLSQNYPNPFNPSTKIRYQVADDPDGGNGITRLVVYNVLGDEVAVLVNEAKEPGTYEVEWNASNLSSGIYFYRMESRNFKEVKKLTLLK